MLGMIEINLLPPEFRVPDRTPIGMFLAIIVGICVVGGIGVYELNLSSELTQKERLNGELTTKREQAKAEKEKVDKLRVELTKAKKRQGAIVEISQSKILWSQKLTQFGQIMAQYPNVWINRLSFNPGGQGGGTLSLGFFLAGDYKDVGAFRERLLADVKFWYHFGPTQGTDSLTTLDNGGPLASQNYKGSVVQFDMSIPVN
jgi:Tfp pilus assembly protein PilN